MKKKQLYELKNAIEKVKTRGNNKFKFLLILNEGIIEPYIKALEKLREPSDSYAKFLEEKRALLMNHAELDEQGAIMLFSAQNGMGEYNPHHGFPNILHDIEEFHDRATELEAQYKDILESEMKKGEEFLQTLEEDVDIELKAISFEDIPEIEYAELKIFMETIVKYLDE